MNIQSDNMELPVVLNVPTTSYFSITLPLCVLLTNDNLLDWYYENFINIYFDNSQNICFFGMSYDVFVKYNTIFDYSISKYEDTCDTSIVERIKYEVLHHSNYAYIFLDEFYICNTQSYYKNHFYHESLIYGFDDKKKVLKAVAFNKDGHLDKLEYPYEDVEKAYGESFGIAPNNEEAISVVWFKVKSDISYKLNLHNVVYSLYDYINGYVPENLPFIQHRYKDNIYKITEESVFGTKVIKSTIKSLLQKREFVFKYYDFRRVHFLYEHALMMYERFEYFQRFALNNKKNEYVKIMELYKRIINKYSVARLLFMELVFFKNIDYKRRKLKIDRIIDILENVYIEEKIVVAKIAEIIQISLHNYYDNIEDAVSKLNVGVVYKSNRVCISFLKPVLIERLEFRAIANIEMHIDNELFELMYFRNNFKNKIERLDVNKIANEITLIVDSEFDVSAEMLDIQIYGGNLLHEKCVKTSSVWKDVLCDGSLDCGPDKAINYDYNQYWRAAEQKGEYNGSDWILVSLDGCEQFNTIVLGELEYSPRIKRYSISYINDDNEEVEWMICDFERGRNNVIMGRTVKAKAIKVNFLICTPDSQGYAEPILKIFKAYNSLFLV